MDIAELPAEALQELYTVMSVPNTFDRTREELRAMDAGFHVETRSRGLDPSHATLALEAAPDHVRGPVITLRFS